MASSGTVSLVIEFKLKTPREAGGMSRESVMVAGHTTIKSVASIEAQDLDLRTVREFIATPFNTELAPARAKTPSILYGSVVVTGSIMNSVYLQTMKGSANPRFPAGGTVHLGSIKGGTLKIGFFALGA